MAALAFAQEIEKSITAGSTAFVNKHANYKTYVERVLAGLDLADDYSKNLTDLFLEDIDWGALFIRNQRKIHGRFQLVRLHTVNGEQRALFRISGAAQVTADVILQKNPTDGGAMIYYDLILQKNPAGDYELVDFESLVVGQPMSRLARWAQLAVAKKFDKVDFSRKNKEEQERLHGEILLGQIMLHNQDEQWGEAAALLDLLPASMRQDRATYYYRCIVSKHLGSEQYIAALADYEKKYPNDTPLLFMQMDRGYDSGDFAQTLAPLEYLQKLIGPDAVLEHFRAVSLLKLDKLEEARKADEHALELDPTRADFCLIPLQAALRAKNWNLALSWIKKYESISGMSLGDVSGNPLFKDFIETDQYKKWQADHAK